MTPPDTWPPGPRPAPESRHPGPARAILALAGAAALATAAGRTPAQTQTVTEPVVITASGAERRLFDTPYAVGTVDASELRAAGPQVNLSEALGRVPGLVVLNRGNYAQDLQINSRGFGARATFGVRGLRLYADGIPASGPDGQGQVSHFDLAGAQRVEVLRGPFTALYGSSSGGVIALVGAAPTAREASVGADAGSQGLRQARVAVAAPFAGGFSLAASASRLEVDGFRPQSSAQRTLANVRLGWEGARDRVVVVVNHLEQPALDPLGLTPAQFAADPDQTAAVALPQDQPGQPGRYDTRKDTRQTQAGASWRHRFDGAGALREGQLAAYAGTRAVTQWQSIPDTAQSPPTHPGGVIDFDRRYQGLDARLRWRWALPGERAAHLVAGASTDRSTEDRRGFRNFTGDGAARLLGVTGALRRDETNSLASRDLYAQAEADLARRWSATLGVRRGRIDFRSADRYVVPSGTPGAAPLNPDDSGALAFRFTNPVAALQWRGAELALRWPLAPTLRTQWALTWLDATVRDSAVVPVGARIAGTVRGSAYGELAWQPGPRAELAAEVTARSSVAANDANTVFAPGYGLLALRAQWRQPLGAGRLELLARLENLADRRVVGTVIVNDGNQRYFEPSPGRGWGLGARFSLAW